MRSNGVSPAEPISNSLLSGKLIRFKVGDDRRPNGWAVLHRDGRPAGADAANAWGDAATDIAEHAALTGTELAVKLLFVAHYNQPGKQDGALAIDLASFDVDTGRAIVRAAADALAMDAGRLWQETRAEYERLRSISDAIPPGTEGEDAALDAYCVAMDALIATPAPNVQAAGYKLALIQARAEGGTPDSYWQALSADLTRLGGQA